jgi:hypothetical protein
MEMERRDAEPDILEGIEVEKGKDGWYKVSNLVSPNGTTLTIVSGSISVIREAVEKHLNPQPQRSLDPWLRRYCRESAYRRRI